VFRTTIAPPLGPLVDPFPLESRLATARTRAALTPILTKDEKIIIIVCACVLGAILLFATFHIGAHNHPF